MEEQSPTKSSCCTGRRKKSKGQAETKVGRWWKMPGSWGREIGGMLQRIGTAGRSFWRRPWLKRGCCVNDDDDDDDELTDNPWNHRRYNVYHPLWRSETLHYTCTVYLWVSYSAFNSFVMRLLCILFCDMHTCVVSMSTERSVVSCPIECRSIVRLFCEAHCFWSVSSGQYNHARSVAACTRVARQLWYLLRTGPCGAPEVRSPRSAVRVRSGC